MDEPKTQTSISIETGKWWVAFCRGNTEKVFAEEMSNAGIPAYCPTEIVRKFNSQGKRIQLERPLFPAYAFVAIRGEEDSPEYAEEMYFIRGNARLVKRTLIRIVDQNRFVHELSQIQRALALGPIERCGYLVPGCRVRITNGPYMGMEGVLEKENGGKIQLVCAQMQAGVIITVKDNVEPI